MKYYYQDNSVTIYHGDCLSILKEMDPESVHCVVTSPPYWGLRDYGVKDQLGLEATPEEYTVKMVEIFQEVRRVLRNDGTVWLNLGDSYFGSSQGYGDTKTTNKNHNGSRKRKKPVWLNCDLKPKDLIGIPWRVAFALQADGWWLRSDIVWSKPNPMPESVKDRPTKSHEYVFLLTKSAKYYFDQDAVREDGVTPIDSKAGHTFGGKKNNTEYLAKSNEPGKKWEWTSNRNIRTVWNIATQPYPEAHFATFPEKLVEPCIKAGCPEGGTVLDPFAGSGTALLVAKELGRKAIGIELKSEYIEMSKKRLRQEVLQLKEVTP